MQKNLNHYFLLIMVPLLFFSNNFAQAADISPIINTLLLSDDSASTSTTTTTTSIKPCVVKFFPASISKLVSLILPIRFFVISGEKGAEFTKDTAVVWDTEGIKTINTFVLGRQNKFLLVQVFIQSQFLEASELYTVKVGDCFGTLKVRAF